MMSYMDFVQDGRIDESEFVAYFTKVMAEEDDLAFAESVIKFIACAVKEPEDDTAASLEEAGKLRAEVTGLHHQQ